MTDQEQILELVDQINKTEFNEESKQWFFKISNKDFDIISTFLTVLSANQESGETEACHSILKAIRSISKLMPDMIDPQITESTDFPTVITSYIKETDVNKLSGDAVRLLCKFYDIKTFEEFNENYDFISMIFDIIPNIRCSDHLKDLVNIVVTVSFYIEDPTDNIVFAILEAHKNQRCFAEILLHVLNMEKDIERTKMQLSQIRDYTTYADRFLFYKNDTKVLVDILLRLLGVHIFTEDPGTLLQEVLDAVTDSIVFSKQPVRVQEIDDLWNEVSEELELPQNNYDILHGISIIKLS